MKWQVWLPIAGFALLVLFLAIGLTRDPREVPSPLIGLAAPAVAMAQLHAPAQQWSPQQMRGKVWMLNVWASWCSACRAEHVVLNEFVRANATPLIGLNYKDEVGDALAWLQQHGNPYTLSVVDAAGRAGIEWGVYGVPETFVVDKRGIIRYKQIGPVTHAALETTLLPLLQRLQVESP